MDKRLYRPGYSLQWNGSKAKANKNTTAAAASTDTQPTGTGENAPTENIALAPEALPEDPALKPMPTSGIAKETHTKHKKDTSVDALIQQSNEEDKAIADKAEGSKEANKLASEMRAKNLTQPSSINENDKKNDFAYGFRRGIQFVHISDVLMDEPRLMPLALAALICGIVSIVAYYGAFVLGVLAIVFGAVALYKIRQNPGVYRGRRMAMAGFILGIISLAIITTIIIFY